MNSVSAQLQLSDRHEWASDPTDHACVFPLLTEQDDGTVGLACHLQGEFTEDLPSTVHVLQSEYEQISRGGSCHDLIDAFIAAHNPGRPNAWRLVTGHTCQSASGSGLGAR